MKYLKRFNETIDIDIIKDICLELEDMGFYIKIYEKKYYIQLNIKRGEYKPDGCFVFSWNNEIKDCLLRIKNYLNYDFISFGYIPAKKQIDEPDYIFIDLNEKTEIKTEIYGLCIRIKQTLDYETFKKI